MLKDCVGTNSVGFSAAKMFTVDYSTILTVSNFGVNVSFNWTVNLLIRTILMPGKYN